MAVKLALTYKQLTKNDIKVLLVLEENMRKYEYVPVEIIERRTRLNPSELSRVLSKLNKLKLVERRIGAHTGYRITILGYDCLAIDSLVKRGVLSALGDRIGTGKESDVFQGLAPSGEKVIVKIHRLGRTSFKHTRRFRSYSLERDSVNWLIESSTAAQREFAALTELSRVTDGVPKPIARSRHVVVTEYVEGVELVEYRDAKDPEGMLLKILDTIKKAYQEVSIVHGDLSEYNVLVTLDEEGREHPLIIDWPQYVYKDDPRAEMLLKRDIEYIIRFFKRRFRVEMPLEKALGMVKGEINAT